jgi:micrococcal nuclease
MRFRLRGSRRRLIYLLSVGLAVVALGLFYSGPSVRHLKVEGLPSFIGDPAVPAGVVQHVIDGDTIEMSNGVRIRYIGLDAPELRRRVGGRWIYDPQPWAEEARRLNQQLVEGKVVRLEYDQERTDRFHRQLAYVFVGDLFVNAELVRSGYARVVLHPPNLKYAKLLKEIEREAKEQQKGIWSPSNSSKGPKKRSFRSLDIRVAG